MFWSALPSCRYTRMANLEMERSLKFAGYEVEHAWGDGGHNGKHGTAVFPDALRFLWKDWPALPKAGLGSSQLKEILVPGADWQLVGEGYKFTEGPTANAAGEVFYNDVPNSKTYKVGADGKPVVFIAETKKGDGQRFGPDGRLYSGPWKCKMSGGNGELQCAQRFDYRLP